MQGFHELNGPDYHICVFGLEAGGGMGVRWPRLETSCLRAGLVSVFGYLSLRSISRVDGRLVGDLRYLRCGVVLEYKACKVFEIGKNDDLLADWVGPRARQPPQPQVVEDSPSSFEFEGINGKSRSRI